MRSLLLLTAAALLCVSGMLAQGAMVLEGAVVFDGIASRPQKKSIIVVDHGRITGFGPPKEVIIPEGAKHLNLKGKYIIPGLVEGHMERSSPNDLLRMLAWGVTSANVMYPSTDEGAAVERWTLEDTSRAPQVYASAPIFSAERGVGSAAGPADSSVGRFPSTPDEARAAVRKARASGLKRIMIVYDGADWCRDPLPRMKKEVMEALVDEASKQRLFTSVRAPKLADAGEALDAGAMSLSNGVINDYLDAATIGTLLTRNDYYVTTFASYEFLADPQAFMKNVLDDKRFRASLPAGAVKDFASPAYAAKVAAAYPNGAFVRSHLTGLRDNLVSLLRNYAIMVMGSDMNALPGIGSHLELAYMVQAGLTPYQALIAATTFGGQYLGAASTIGTIEAGRQADLVILDADPVADIRNTRSVSTVMKHGILFDPKKLLKAANR